jgi:predicted nucleic acid-binding protein
MPFVLDASVAVAWCFDDESAPESESILDQLQDEAAIAPAIWPLEVANALRNGERRGRLQRGDTLRFTELLGDLLVEVEPLTLARALDSVLFVAREYDLSA